MAKYTYINYVFDLERFQLVLNMACEQHTVDTIGQLLEVSPSTVSGWRSVNYQSSDFPHPSMSNFLKVVNLLDLHPGDFFKLEDE